MWNRTRIYSDSQRKRKIRSNLGGLWNRASSEAPLIKQNMLVRVLPLLRKCTARTVRMKFNQCGWLAVSAYIMFAMHFFRCSSTRLLFQMTQHNSSVSVLSDLERKRKMRRLAFAEYGRSSEAFNTGDKLKYSERPKWKLQISDKILDAVMVHATRCAGKIPWMRAGRGKVHTHTHCHTLHM